MVAEPQIRSCACCSPQLRVLQLTRERSQPRVCGSETTTQKRFSRSGWDGLRIPMYLGFLKKPWSQVRLQGVFLFQSGLFFQSAPTSPHILPHPRPTAAQHPQLHIEPVLGAASRISNHKLHRHATPRLFYLGRACSISAARSSCCRTLRSWYA